MTSNNVPAIDLVANEWEDFSLTFWLYDNELPIASVAETSPISVACRYHNKATNDKVVIGGVICDDGRWSNANGLQTITKIDAHTFTLNSTTTNGPTTKAVGIMGTPRNCTGGSIECEFRLTPEDAEAITPAFTITPIDPTVGNYKLSISGEYLSTLVTDGNDQISYDLIYIDSAGVRHREFRGAFVINKSITKG